MNDPNNVIYQGLPITAPGVLAGNPNLVYPAPCLPPTQSNPATTTQVMPSQQSRMVVAPDLATHEYRWRYNP